jgi:hypothetical protein
MPRIGHRHPLHNRVPAVITDPPRTRLAEVVIGLLRKRAVIDFVNTLPARSAPERCDLLVFRLRIIHEVTRMLTQSFTDRVLVFASEDD